MSALDVPRFWPRVAFVALFAIGAAGCSDSGRFEVNNPFSSKKDNAPPQEVTGSIANRPAQTAAVTKEPLPAPSKPQTVAASGGVAQGAGGLGAYRPAAPSGITGSVAARPAPAGHWSWEGGTPITVSQGDTLEIIGRKYGVPTSATMQANGVSSTNEIKPGQRLVIPRYVASNAPQQAAPAVSAPASAPASTPVAAAPASETVHTVALGESLTGIARKYHVPLTTIAKANNIEPFAKVNAGDRLTIPGQRVPQKLASAGPVTSLAPATVATVPPPQQARIATPETRVTESPAKAAEPTGAMPSFRWPVHGRIISAFGARSNGQPNDGINLAVPEGTPVKAADDGVVAYAGNELKGYGNLVLIKHASGYVSAYAHASEILVKRGDTIKRGQMIARSGQTGNVTSPQLHFEIRKGSTPVDPSQYLAGNTNG